MKRVPNEAELRNLLAEVSQREASALRLDDDFAEDLGLDSLDRLELLAAIEDRFKLRFNNEQLSEVTSLSGLLAALGITAETRRVAA